MNSYWLSKRKTFVYENCGTQETCDRVKIKISYHRFKALGCESS